MTLLAPLGLAICLLAIPVVLLYILRLRRPDRTASSTLFWRVMTDDMQANAPWQHLRPTVLLGLQLFAILVLALAVARPAYSSTAVASGDVVAILDQSTSMAAHDISPSRFGAAQARAEALAGSLGPNDTMSVIGMTTQPRLALAGGTSPAAARAAIRSLHPTRGVPNLLAALSLADSLVRPGIPLRVVVFTDRSSGISGLPLRVRFPVEVVRLGGALSDLAITAFSSAPGNTTRAVVRVRNYGHATANSNLELIADGHLVDVRPLGVPPSATVNETWNDLPQGIQVLQAHLTRRDDMGLDKTAWSVVPAPETRHVLLVTAGNYFLESVLASDSSTRVAVISPDEYEPSLAARSDLVVFDGYLPPSLPDTSTLLVNPPSGRIDGITVGSSVKPGSLARGSTALMSYVDLGGVHVAEARRLSLPPWASVLARSAATPVIAAGINQQMRVGIIGFNLQESDWPLQVSFPVAMQHIISYLAPGTTGGTFNVDSGRPVQIVAPADVSSISVAAPSGNVKRLHPPFAPFTGTEQTGIYTLRLYPGHTSLRFAVNDFQPRGPELSGPSVLHLGAPGETGQTSLSTPVSLGWAFGLLALVVLLTEWFVAYRR